MAVPTSERRAGGGGSGEGGVGGKREERDSSVTQNPENPEDELRGWRCDYHAGLCVCVMGTHTM